MNEITEKKKLGRPFSTNKKAKISISLSGVVYKSLSNHARETGQPISGVAELAIQMYFGM